MGGSCKEGPWPQILEDRARPAGVSQGRDPSHRPGHDGVRDRDITALRPSGAPIHEPPSLDGEVFQQGASCSLLTTLPRTFVLLPRNSGPLASTSFLLQRCPPGGKILPLDGRVLYSPRRGVVTMTPALAFVVSLDGQRLRDLSSTSLTPGARGKISSLTVPS